jgi:hypothetical protein
MVAQESCLVYLGLMLNYTSTTHDTGITKLTLGRLTMNTDTKWFVILMIVFISLPLMAFALRDYRLGQCRVEAIQAGMDVEKIAQVCK